VVFAIAKALGIKLGELIDRTHARHLREKIAAQVWGWRA
jgi:hypothetical protein